ncbi:MAG: DUF4197 domain-containing protein, partial [Pseudomonadota bacterium]
MRMILIASALLVGGCASDAEAQDWRKALGAVIEENTDIDTSAITGGSGDGLTSGEIGAGLKEALTIGARAVGGQLSAADGYFGDDAIRIPLPGVLGDAQERLQPFGMSGPLDDLQLRMNRAAESAAPKARDLVVDAVQDITIEDAVGILNGGDTAATDYLKSKTSTPLAAAFKPYVETALSESGALQAVEGVADRYGASSLGADARDSLTEHAVDGALEGLFYYIAKEEAA